MDIQYVLYGFSKNKNKVVAQHDLSAHAASIVELPVLLLINHMYGFIIIKCGMSLVGSQSCNNVIQARA